MEQAGSRMLYVHRESPSVTTPTKRELLRSTLEQKHNLDYGTAGEPNCNLHYNSEESDSFQGDITAHLGQSKPSF